LGDSSAKVGWRDCPSKVSGSLERGTVLQKLAGGTVLQNPADEMPSSASVTGTVLRKLTGGTVLQNPADEIPSSSSVAGTFPH